MTEETYWKSALKASFLLYLANVVIVAFLIGFFPELALDFMKNLNPQNLAAHLLTILFLFFVYSLLTIAGILVWGLFGKFYNKIPTSRTVTKAFIFNLVLSAMTYGARELMKTSPVFLSGLPDHLYFTSKILDIILWPIFFTILFNYFEKNTKSAELNKKILPASIGRRIVAFLIDFVLVAIVSNIILILAVTIYGACAFVSPQNPLLPNKLRFALEGFSTIFAVSFALAYWTYLEGKYGRTVGKKLVDIKVVKTNGAKATYWDAFFRNFTKSQPTTSLLFWIEAIILILGKSKQRFSDKIANTCVVRVKSK